MKFNCFHLWWVFVNFYTYFGFKLDVSGLKITRENHEQIEMRNTRMPEKTTNRLKWVTCRLWQNFHRSASSLAAESWYWGNCTFGSSIISCQVRPQKIFLQIPSPNISYFLLVGMMYCTSMISLMALPPIGAVHETPASHLGRSPRICSCRGRSADTEIMKQLFAFFVFVYNICICICICIYNWCGQRENLIHIPRWSGVDVVAKIEVEESLGDR